MATLSCTLTGVVHVFSFEVLFLDRDLRYTSVFALCCLVVPRIRLSMGEYAGAGSAKGYVLVRYDVRAATAASGW